VTSTPPGHITLGARPLRLALAMLVAALSLLGLAAELGFELAHGEDPYGLVQFTGLSYEQNLPTWVASALLLACALLLWLIGRAEEGGTECWRRHWYLLAALFAYASLDEATELHENWGAFIDSGDALGGLLYFSWVIPAAAVVLGLALLYRRFLLALPAATRRRFLLAAALYLGGALVMELPLGYWTSRHGVDNLGYGLIDWLEETLELAGASVFLYALALHLLAAPAGLTLSLEPSPCATTRGAGRD
jgi:hypothetical protein